MQKKYPQLVIGAFLFNNKNELFLKTSPSQQNTYTCINGRIQWGDTIEQTIQRIVQETVNLSVTSHRLIGLTNGLNIRTHENDELVHMVFADYKATVENTEQFTINNARSYDWLTPQQWLKKPDSTFGPYIKEIITKLA